MNTTNTMNDGSGIRVPSGYEVESATFHSTGRSGFRGRLDELKSRGVQKVHDLQHRVATTGSSMRDGVTRQVSNTQTSMQASMRNKPMMWAGIAAGSGFALGLIGRLMDRRGSHRRMRPDLVIIDATC